MCVSITAAVHFLCLYMDDFLSLNIVVDVIYLTKSKIFFMLFIDFVTENLTLSFKNSAVYQREIYAGLKEVFELLINIEVVQGNTNCTVQNKMWL